MIYVVGNKLPKRDKLGIHSQIEKITLQTFSNILGASFAFRTDKKIILNRVRISLEVLKNLVRTEHELKIIEEKSYIRIESALIETSKMTNGWIKYLSTQNPPKL